MQNDTDELDLFQYGLFYHGECADMISVTIPMTKVKVIKPNKNRTKRAVENSAKKVQKSR